MLLRTLTSTIVLFISTGLMAHGYTEINNVGEYRKIMKNNNKPLVVMYSSPTCGPCKSMKPFFDKLARELTDISCYVVNASSKGFDDILNRLQITGFPTLIMTHNKKEIKRERGGMSSKELATSLKDFRKQITQKPKETKKTEKPVQIPVQIKNSKKTRIKK
jgi:thiol-disulfide isomerase/thioredoxin